MKRIILLVGLIFLSGCLCDKYNVPDELVNNSEDNSSGFLNPSIKNITPIDIPIGNELINTSTTTTTSSTISTTSTTSTTLINRVKVLNESLQKCRYVVGDILKTCQSMGRNIINYTLENKSIYYISNIRPNKCHNAQCSDGYFKCKNDVLNWFELKKSKFNERPKSNIMELFNIKPKQVEPVCFLPTANEDAIEFQLNASMWWVMRNYDNDTVIITRI